KSQAPGAQQLPTCGKWIIYNKNTSKSIFNIFQLPDSQVNWEVEFQVAQATENIERALKARVCHVAPRLVVGLYQSSRFADEVDPGDQALLV
ncbi:hypothetical protein N320_08973, partial [Buceros rhinoceros silvestris]